VINDSGALKLRLPDDVDKVERDAIVGLAAATWAAGAEPFIQNSSRCRLQEDSRSARGCTGARNCHPGSYAHVVPLPLFRRRISPDKHLPDACAARAVVTPSGNQSRSSQGS
jgi:hypothetical protein